ncbi:PAS domain S-box protein [Acetobacteraceae bacterium H6797]|nr:PAS domain S-box protein [Acetobacteraceae bacterium H6797]
MDGLPHGLCLFRPDGRLRFANRAARLLAPDDRELCNIASRWGGNDEALALIRAGEAPPAREACFALGNGNWQWLRVSFTAWRDAQGQVAGLLASFGPSPLIEADGSDRQRHVQAMQHLAAIVESSDDAILTKDLTSTITTWNKGAERLFGYSAAEAVGRSVTMLIPPDMPDEEPSILARIRRGEAISHYETTRRRKDGSLVEISLSVSPVRDAWGVIVGASKIARDITDRRRAEEGQRLLMREMNHRVKNLFSLVSGMISLSLPYAESAQALGLAMQARLGALARAHDLTMPLPGTTRAVQMPTTLRELMQAVFAAYDHGMPSNRISLQGEDPPLAASSVTAFALLLHEFATNAAKYGGLSVPHGYVLVETAFEGEDFTLTWRERGGPELEGAPIRQGFGRFLTQATVQGQLGGRIEWDWQPEGAVIHLSIPRERLLG